MVEEGKITANVAYRITQAFWPNKEKIIRITEMIKKMTRPEWERILDIGKSKPDSSVEEIIKESQKPPKIVKIEIEFSRDIYEQLEKIRKERKAVDIKEVITTLIEEIVEAEAT